MSKYPINLAVLISGPLRTFADVWPKNLSILEELNLSYKCFMHTWDKNFDTFKNIFESNNTNFFWRWSPKKLKNFDGQPSQIISSLGENWKVKIESMENAYSNFPKIQMISKQNQVYLNSIAMYHGMKEVAQLAISSKDKFTHYLRIRSDSSLPKHFAFADSRNLIMYGSTVSIFGSRVSDQCFSGGFQETLSSMFVIDTLRRNVERDGWINFESGLPRYAENSMYEHLNEIGLLNQIKVTPRKNTVLVIRNAEVKDDSISHLNFYKACIRKNQQVLKKKIFRVLSYFSNKFRIAGFVRRLFTVKNFSNFD
jgi:hypothetical protein